VEKINFVELFKRRPDFLAYAVAALLSTLVLLRVLELVCTRMCKSSGKRKVPEYDERQTFPFSKTIYEAALLLLLCANSVQIIIVIVIIIKVCSTGSSSIIRYITLHYITNYLKWPK